MDDLVNSGASAVSDPEAALMVTNAIKSIIGDDKGEEGGGGSSSVGLEVTTKAVDATELVVDALLNMEIASPDDLKPAITSVAETVGTIMNLMLGENTESAGANDTANDTVVDDDPCAGIPVIDKV